MVNNEHSVDGQELPGAECCMDEEDDDNMEASPNVKVRQIKREAAGDYDGYETIQLTKSHDDDAI